MYTCVYILGYMWPQKTGSEKSSVGMACKGENKVQKYTYKWVLGGAHNHSPHSLAWKAIDMAYYTTHFILYISAGILYASEDKK